MLKNTYIKRRYEGSVTYNQKGYVGQSMSVRASAAYDNGEMPKSKWTKQAILGALEYMFGEQEASGFRSFSKDKLFDAIMINSSWHHTGKFANATNFYSPDRIYAIKFADENHIASMSSLVSSDEEYREYVKQQNDAMALREREQAEQKLKDEAQKQKAKELYQTMPSFVSDGLRDIESGTHRGYDVKRFTVTLKGFCSFSFHAYLEDVDLLEHFWNDLKDKRKTNDTDDFWCLCSYVCAMLFVDSAITGGNYDDSLDWKDYNIKQLPVSGDCIRKFVLN